MLKHYALHIVEPELFDGYNPMNKMVLHQVTIDKMRSPIEVTVRGGSAVPQGAQQGERGRVPKWFGLVDGPSSQGLCAEYSACSKFRPLREWPDPV